MPAEIHLVHSRPPILDAAAVWIDPPGRPRPQIPSGSLWEWPEPPPKRSWRPAVQIALALVITLGAVTDDESAEPKHPLPFPLPVPD